MTVLLDPNALGPTARQYMTSYVGNIVGALRRVHRLGVLVALNDHAKKKRRKRREILKHATPPERTGPDVEPDWSGRCENCGQSPVMPATGMCGPCMFGEADTAGGNW